MLCQKPGELILFRFEEKTVAGENLTPMLTPTAMGFGWGAWDAVEKRKLKNR